ncbi:hypothetical protein EDC01DRAFT_627536 [Geopyxis carbonaria]|nr:hypothetical protein EDC01DRAFT_627536 [Geopyxis carbonaria]
MTKNKTPTEAGTNLQMVEQLPSELHLGLIDKLLVEKTPKALDNWINSNTPAKEVFNNHGEPLLSRRCDGIRNKAFSTHFDVMAEQTSERQRNCHDATDNLKEWRNFQDEAFEK